MHIKEIWNHLSNANKTPQKLRQLKYRNHAKMLVKLVLNELKIVCERNRDSFPPTIPRSEKTAKNYGLCAKGI